MPYNPDIHHRRSIRLSGYDYAQPGTYFVTLCAWQRECLFGEITDGAMRLNDAGRIVAREWCRTAALRQNIVLDAWVVMPNHLHGILVFTGGGSRTAPTSSTCLAQLLDAGAVMQEQLCKRSFEEGIVTFFSRSRDTFMKAAALPRCACKIFL